MPTAHAAAFAAVALLAMPAAAQHTFPVQHTTRFGPLQDTWSGGVNLGNAPAGSYTAYLVATDWTSAGAGGDNSGQAGFALHTGPLAANPGSNGTGPSGSGSIIAYRTMDAVGAVNTATDRTQMFWFGTMGVPQTQATYTASGNDPLYLSWRTNAAVPGNGGVRNTRVTLNPRVTDTRTFVGRPAPTTFTDLGTLNTGAVSIDLPVSVSQGLGGERWARFSLTGDVSNALANTFDIFTTTNAGNGSINTGLILWRETSVGLIPVASTNPLGAGPPGVAKGLTFGSADAAAYGRPYGATFNPGYFDGRGGEAWVSRPWQVPPGFVGGTPGVAPAGVATLSAAQTYWLTIGSVSWGSSAGASIALDPDAAGVTMSGQEIYSLGVSTRSLNTTIFFRSVPAPGPVAILAMCSVLILRRRR
ncbi:MAG: hypothetical protein SFY69_02930 [Planctomycetota bacterium]|nr:hypothetical protein [Planctomycetota bacterium]